MTTWPAGNRALCDSCGERSRPLPTPDEWLTFMEGHEKCATARKVRAA